MSEAAKEAVAGAIGSALSMAATYPLQTLSTWQALDHQDSTANDEDELKTLSALPAPLRDFIVCVRRRGLMPLFAGLKTTLVATAISNAIYFYLYSGLRQAVVAHRQVKPVSSASSRTTDIGVLGSLVVASLAGAGNVLATTPVWVISSQLQAQQRKPTSAQQPADQEVQQSMTALGVAADLYKEGGVGGFWRGLLPSLVMVSNPTLQYALYEWLSSRLLDLRRGAKRRAGAAAATVRLGPGDAFVLSAIAKCGATILTYPMQVIKSRLQVINSSTEQDMRYTGVWDAVLRIARNEGWVGFFKGMRVKLVQTVLAAALLMSIKEYVYNAVSALAHMRSARRAGLLVPTAAK